MNYRGFSKDETAALGLPIRMVVLTIVGLAGVTVMLAALAGIQTTPGMLYVMSNSTSFSMNGTTGASPHILLKVVNSEDEPVPGASVVVWGPDHRTAKAGTTDAFGEFTFRLENMSLPTGKNEGYIAVKVMQEGYLDLDEQYLIKVRSI
ncbi:carboxypeptidase-like regulatory domain-containing protein [uncultured Methanomethylovorans sp.]|uniref:carboxypeptidase-like regulatory domain-containing protein n=1 Tax=uncultured Methanomethylovorans sp. TaxID=183759 RepID=UPI002AA76DE6|nr:carboxypeptidase-like regulatory domain-containing protein [uncultured Methanomethylovorans sp.]